MFNIKLKTSTLNTWIMTRTENWNSDYKIEHAELACRRLHQTRLFWYRTLSLATLEREPCPFSRFSWYPLLREVCHANARARWNEKTHAFIYLDCLSLKTRFQIPNRNVKIDLMISATVEMLAAFLHVIPHKERIAIMQRAIVHISLRKGKKNGMLNTMKTGCNTI